MMMNMEIKVTEEEPTQMKGESWVDEEKNYHLPISQIFQLLQQSQPQRQSLHSSSISMDMKIHDYPQKAARCKRKRRRDKHSNDHVVKALPAVKRKTEEAWAKSPVIKRAEEVQANLSAEFPSFLKIMIPSMVCRGFWMEGAEWWWKKFSTEHGLAVGDAVVFHLIRPSNFEVYIVRVNSLAEVDATLGLLRLESSAKQTGISMSLIKCHSLLFISSPTKLIEFDFITIIIDCEPKQDHAGKNDSEPFSQDINQYEVHRNSLSYIRAGENQSKNGSLDIGSGEVEGIRSSSEVNAEFKQLRGTEKFTILVNGLALDSMLSKRFRNKYYELCCSHKSYLHDNLHKNVNSTLAADIISQTVNIADAIRASEIFTPQADFVAWENTLSGFELLGMDVGFLRNRVHQLLNLAFKSEKEVKSRRYKETKLERAYAEQEARSHGLELLVKKEEVLRLDAEIEALKLNSRWHKQMYEAAVNAPW